MSFAQKSPEMKRFGGIRLGALLALGGKVNPVN